ncbi:hypothetical protein [Streptomyces carpinensis]|uniref:hypothetical protein n=1 Tax=Streptomyces carpinensis TaxID=66369 RepID=UPI00130271E5|nr:hypothetical protein [Streptomyces carpinensis]
MSVSRTAARLLATCVASGILVGAAAMPALAAGADHHRDNGRAYPHSQRWEGNRNDHDHDGRRGRFGDWDRDRGRHHGWYDDRRDQGRHHGWFHNRHRDHHHFLGHH